MSQNGSWSQKFLWPIDLCLNLSTVHSKIASPPSYAAHFPDYIRPLSLKHYLERLVNQLALGKTNIRRNKEENVYIMTLHIFLSTICWELSLSLKNKDKQIKISQVYLSLIVVVQYIGIRKCFVRDQLKDCLPQPRLAFGQC